MTPSEKFECIKPLLDRGMTYGQIATAMGWTRNKVAGLVSRNRSDNPDPKKVMNAKPMHGFESRAAMARWYGVSEGKLRNSGATP